MLLLNFSGEWHNSITDLGWPYKVETNPRWEEQIDGSRPAWVVNQPIILSHHRAKLFRHMLRKVGFCIEIIMDAKNINIAVLDVPQISRKYFHINTHSGENMLAANWQIGIIHFPRSTFMGEFAEVILLRLLAKKKLNCGLPPLLPRRPINSFVRLREVGTGLIGVASKFILIHKF